MVYLAKAPLFDTTVYTTWQDWYNAKSLLRTKDPNLDSDITTDFTFASRLNGGESVTFTAFEPLTVNDLLPGRVYFVFADRQMQKPLPCTFILTKANLIKDGVCENKRRYICEGVGVEDYLRRRWLNPKYRNIGFQSLLTKLLNQTREKVPELNSDTSLIQDVDYTFTIVNKRNAYLGDIIDEIRSLGYSIYITHDLKLYAANADLSPQLDIDFKQSTINGKICVLSNSQIGYEYSPSPITSLVLVGGTSTEGNIDSLNVLSNEEPTYDLNANVFFEDNFVLETFDSTDFERIDATNIAGTGWEKRYGIFNDPITPGIYFSSDVNFELVSSTGTTYLLGINDGNFLDVNGVIAGFKIENQTLKIIANQTEYSSGQTLKAFEQKIVQSIDALRTTVTLDNVTNLNVGDFVNVAGINSTISAVDATILSINTVAKTVTIDKEITTGTLTVGDVLLQRVEEYTLRLSVNSDLYTEFYLKRTNGNFELLGTYFVPYFTNAFMTIWNNYDGAVATNDEGIYEVGNIALDYWFIDKATYIRMFDKDFNKVYLCTQDQFSVVEADAVVNRINKNGEDLAQVEFVSPSIVRTVYDSTGTIYRIPLVLRDDDFLKIGMRVLVNDEAYQITNFNKSLTSGYIDVSPALTTIPSVQTPVYINTSIPPLNSAFKVEYVPAVSLVVRECASDNCLNQFGFRERQIDVPEFTSVTAIADRAQELIEEECTPKASGTFYFYMFKQIDCPENNVLPYTDLPFVGGFIQVSDSDQSISNELARIQSIQIREIDQLFQVSIDFGAEKVYVNQALTNLVKKFGFLKDEVTDQDFNVPCILRDSLTVTDDSLNFSASTGYAFLSGLYTSNYSGATE